MEKLKAKDVKGAMEVLMGLAATELKKGSFNCRHAPLEAQAETSEGTKVGCPEGCRSEKAAWGRKAPLLREARVVGVARVYAGAKKQ